MEKTGVYILEQLSYYNCLNSTWKSQSMAAINTLKMQQRTSMGRFSGFCMAEFLALGSDRNWVSYLKWQSDFRFPLRRLDWVLSSSPQTDGNANVSDLQTSSGLYLKILQVKVCKTGFALGLIFFYLQFHRMSFVLPPCVGCGCVFHMGQSWVWDERRWAFDCWYPGIRCKDTAGIMSADHLTVKKETDSSWKANEHVSAIWKSHPKHYTSPVLRQRSHFTLWKDLFSLFHCRWSRILELPF